MSAWVILALAASAIGGEATASATAAPETAGALPAERHSQQAGWWIVETANFRVCSRVSSAESARIARHCEALRHSIRDLWLPGVVDSSWTPRCDVIAHSTEAGYLRAVGRGAAHTAGSALVEFSGTAVAVRRVDLKHAAPEALESALAHELTHVVLADRFRDRPLPRWADEGMAVLADSLAKQRLHWRDLQQGLRSRSTLRLAEIVSLADYPAPQRMGVFYGQSVSLVSYLLARGQRGQFVEFVDAALSRGYDQALRDVYQIDGLSELERRWLASVTSGPARFVSRTPADFPVIESLRPSTRTGT